MVQIKEAIEDTQIISTNKCLLKEAEVSFKHENNLKEKTKKIDGNEEINNEQKVDFELINEVRNLLEKEFNLNADKYSSEHYNDLMNLNSPIACWRYLLYCKLSVDDTFDLIKRALIWRKENNIENVSNADQAKEFWLFGPIHFVGKTKDNKDLIYINGKDYRKANGEFSKIVIKYAINFLFQYEKKNMDNLNKITFVFDTTNCGFRNVDIEFMSWLISVIDFLPNRIEKVFVTGIPFILRGIVRLIISWLPSKLSSIVYCGTHEELVEKNVDDDNIPNDVGGSKDDSYRIAPIDATWIENSIEFNKKKIIDAMEYSLCGNISEEKRKLLREMQINYENKLKLKE